MDHVLAKPLPASRLNTYVKGWERSLTPPHQSQAARRALPDGYVVLHQGQTYDVMIRAKVREKLTKKATKDQRSSFEDLVERYGETGPDGFPRGKFNRSEAWFPSQKDKRVLLQAFKAGQLRVYGYCQQFNGRPTFFVTGFDRSKKQDDADQEILAAAGREAVRIYDTLK